MRVGRYRAGVAVAVAADGRGVSFSIHIRITDTCNFISSSFECVMKRAHAGRKRSGRDGPDNYITPSYSGSHAP